MEVKMYFWDKHKAITSYYELLSGEVCDRIQSEDNKKHIEIVLLDRAALIVEAGLNAQKQFAQDVLSGLTKEERHMCIKVFDKICNNAEEHLREYKRSMFNNERKQL